MVDADEAPGDEQCRHSKHFVRPAVVEGLMQALTPRRRGQDPGGELRDPLVTGAHGSEHQVGWPKVDRTRLKLSMVHGAVMAVPRPGLQVWVGSGRPAHTTGAFAAMRCAHNKEHHPKLSNNARSGLHVWQVQDFG